jgi:hypothetical protein
MAGNRNHLVGQFTRPMLLVTTRHSGPPHLTAHLSEEVTSSSVMH